MKWADARAAQRFLEQHLSVGRALPLTMTVDGVLTTVAGTSQRCDLCGNVLGWVGEVQAHCRVDTYQDYGAVAWTGLLRNDGASRSPLLSGIQAADLELGPVVGDLVVRHALGSTCEVTDFLPVDTPLGDGDALELAPVGGRSSNGALPFLNLSWEGGGVVVAIGWSGQWRARIESRGYVVGLRIGQEHTSLRLRAGEEIRTPKVLLVFYEGEDYQCGNNVLRQCILRHFSPRHDGEAFIPPVTHNTWFVFDDGNETTEANQLGVVERLAGLDLGTEVYWLDAGWFEGGWPGGVGSWHPRADHFPRGLKPLGDAVHDRGMRFCVWFEPERVSPDSRIAREHPEFVLEGPVNWTGVHDGLFNLGDAEARAYLTDLLSAAIAEAGIDIYRNDFNIDPLAFWRAHDEPEREGMAEIRYCEGLYRLWDDLAARHPGLMVDNCASGGRRIDLETIVRSIALWRSDTAGFRQAGYIGDQVQASGLTRYVPLSSGGVWAYDPYSFWGVATMGVNHCPHITAEGFDLAALRARVEELMRWRPLWLGNFWALTDVTTSPADWCAWQLHRPDLGEGLVMAFRRPEAPDTITLRPREIEPERAYRLWYNDGLDATVASAHLAETTAHVPEAPGLWTLHYRAGAALGAAQEEVS